MPKNPEPGGNARMELVEKARAARVSAYAPYSHYSVGAAIRTTDGTVYTGANVENASYPVGLCAERVALFSAVAAGERKFQAVAVVTAEGASPCGACRQALVEFGRGIEVILADDTGMIRQVVPLDQLLPFAFDDKNIATPHFGRLSTRIERKKRITRKE
jgi:cytidine deaminase